MRPCIEVWFELETRCNLRCKFCYNYWRSGEQAAPARLSARDLIVCFEHLRRVSDISKVTLSGGEPLLRQDLPELLDYLSGLRMPLVMTTNGLLLDEHRIDQLVSKGVRTFEVPLHAADPAIHDQLSGLVCFDRSLDTIITLARKGLTVVPVFVATSINLAELQDVIRICASLGLHAIIVNRAIPSGMALVNREEIGIPTDKEMVAGLLACLDLAAACDMTIHLGVPVHIDASLMAGRADRIRTASCPVRTAQTRWTVDAAGNLRRCNHSAHTIGNLLRGGEVALQQELARSSTRCNGFHPCQFVDEHRPYEVSIR